MKVYIPDHNQAIEFPAQLSVAEVRRVLAQMGYSQVEGAEASTDAEGNITFARQTGGAKA